MSQKLQLLDLPSELLLASLLYLPLCDIRNLLRLRNGRLMITAIILASTDVLNQGMASVDVELVQFSSTNLHPLAARPSLHLHRTTAGADSFQVSVAIVGSTLAICTRYDETAELDLLYLYQWRTGELLRVSNLQTFGFMSLQEPQPVICGDFTFLADDTIIVPSYSPWALKIFFASPKQLVIVVELLLPELLDDGYTVDFESLTFFRQPTPRSESTRPYTHSRFYPNSTDALIVVSFLIDNIKLDSSYPCQLVISRLSLLNRFLNCIHDLNATGSTPHIQLPWSDWGRNITRFLYSAEVINNARLLSTLGQRLVSVGINLEEEPIHVLDFNPHVIQRVAAMDAKMETQANCTLRVVDSESDVAVFKSSQLDAQLPYVHLVSTELFRL
ncbi:hypothetical protein C8F01DRAFT_1371110 [Mycena amicta]|nr:hypothetical protein C8F01DRAFT_1371110 [Mycena amicta]